MAGRSDLTIHQFRVFDTVVRSGSLTQAALTLDIPQPSISRVIARLEGAVGALLLNRSSAGVSVTTAGECFHRNAVSALHYHDLAIEEARASKGLLIGDVRIAAPDSVAGILFAPLVQSLRNSHERVRLRTIASQSTEIPAMLASGSIDIGIVANTHGLPPGLHEPLFREELYLIGPGSAPLMKKATVSLAEVAPLPLVINAMPGGFRNVIDEGFSELGIAPRIEIEMDANNALLDLVDSGAGYSILPYSLVASLRSRRSLSATRLINPTLMRTLFLITAQNKPIRSVVREVMRQIRTTVAAKSPEAKWLSIDQD